MGKMDGRVALITGGASGLGLEDARVFAAEGAKVVITDVQDDLGEQAAAEISGVEILPICRGGHLFQAQRLPLARRHFRPAR